MKFLLICLLFQTLYAQNSATVTAKIKINQLSDELSLQQRKVTTCTKHLHELSVSVSKQETFYASLSSEVKDIRATVTEENGMLQIDEQKLAIAQKLIEQNQEVSFDLAHKNKDNEKILQKKIAELTQSIEELTMEFQGLSVGLTKTRNARDKENEKGEELDARVSALNIKMEAVLKALKQAQSDAEDEQLRRIESSAKRLATYIRKWDSEEAKAGKLEGELEKLEKLYARLSSVELTLTKEFHDTKVVYQNTADEIIGIDYNAEEERRLLGGDPEPKSTVDDVLLKLDDLDDIEQSVLNLVNPGAAKTPAKKTKPMKKKKVGKAAKQVGKKMSNKVEKTAQVYFSKDKDGKFIAIDVNKNSLLLGDEEFKYVALNAMNPLEKISVKVRWFKEEIGKAVRSLSTCRDDVVSQNSILQKLQAKIASEQKEMTCAQKEIKEVYALKEEVEIKLQEAQAEILLIDENNKALAAENDAGDGRIQSYLASLKEYREQVHAIQLKISNQHADMSSLKIEIENEREHEGVVVKMVANIESTIKHISAKTAELQGKADCPTLQEQENDQKLVLVKGAYNEANTRVVSADKTILRKKTDIEAIEAKIKLLYTKINSLRFNINKISETSFLGELPEPHQTVEVIKDWAEHHDEAHYKDISDIYAVGSGVQEIVPFYKNQWTWLLMILSFAGGYFGSGFLNKKSSDHYQQILVPSEIALQKI